MKITTLSVAVTLALASASAFAQDHACRNAIAEAQRQCGSDNDPVTCIRDRAPSRCHDELRREQDDVTTFPRMTVVGTRFAIDVDKYPGSASILLDDDLDKSTEVIRALDGVPGIDTGNDNGRSVGQQYSIRGFGYSGESRVIVMLDGVPRSTNLYSNLTSSFRVDSDLIQQVDVVRGSSSISHGGGAIGGVINMVTKDAEDFILPGNEVGLATRVRYDSNNQRQGYAAFGFAPDSLPVDLLAFLKKSSKGDLRLAERIRPASGDAYRDIANDEDMTSLFLKAGWDIAEGQRLTLSHFDYRDDTEVAWQSLYNQELSSITGPVVGSLEQRDTVLRYVADPASNPWLNLSATAYTSQAFYERGYDYVDSANARQTLYYKNQDKRWGVSAQNLMTFSTGPVNHRLLLGVDYQHREEDALYDLNGVLSDFGSMPNEYDDMGIFIQHESRYFDDRLALQLGGRYDKFKRKVLGVPENYDNGQFSPRIGVSFELFPQFNLLANYSESFRAPTPHETSSVGPLNINYWYLPNPDLKPETSREYELGFSWRKQGLFTADDHFHIKTMYFTGKIEDMIDLYPDLTGPTPPQSLYYATYRNIGQVDRHGVEFEASYRQPRWGAQLSYEHLNQQDRETHERTPWAFADKIQLGLSLRPMRSQDFEVSAQIKHWLKPDQNPKSYTSRGVTYFYVHDDYTHVDLNARWRPVSTGIDFLDDSTQFLLGIDNLFDQRRLHPSNVETSTRVGLGRNIYLSISKQF
ncbi:MAG: TonB-dependent receptor [Xanthomonadaceae bacterium]|jgi:iron complex outermembrane receptor protein/hemoglobin/transferrin/lactoferrin receptor protein|nr:TonB-dependent receptor [Xanthomonadaceae bacterium]